jgi:hypothetical protein
MHQVVAKPRALLALQPSRVKAGVSMDDAHHADDRTEPSKTQVEHVVNPAEFGTGEVRQGRPAMAMRCRVGRPLSAHTGNRIAGSSAGVKKAPTGRNSGGFPSAVQKRQPFSITAIFTRALLLQEAER